VYRLWRDGEHEDPASQVAVDGTLTSDRIITKRPKTMRLSLAERQMLSHRHTRPTMADISRAQQLARTPRGQAGDLPNATPLADGPASAFAALKARSFAKRSASKLHKLIKVSEYAAGMFFGECEAFDAHGLLDNPVEPLHRAKPPSGKAVAEASIIATERCEMLVMDDRDDIRAFHHCLNVTTLEFTDKLLTVGQYCTASEDELASIAVFGRERYFAPGEEIFKHGDHPEYVVFVMDGMLKALATDPRKEEEKKRECT